MEKQVRNVAISFSVVIFFLMAGVGWFSGLSPVVCCNRALIGAVVAYAVVSIAGKIVIRIILGQIVDSRYGRDGRKNEWQ